MKNVIKGIVIAIFAAGTAYAQPAAFDTLMATAGPAAAIEAPVVRAPLKMSEPGVYDLGASAASRLATDARALGYAVFELDGSRMKSKPELMAHTAKVLGLPKDMDNWDAFIDYMSDMPQIHANEKILIMIRNASQIRMADPKLYADLRETAAFCSQRAREWKDYSLRLKFVFVQ
jgi:hypothetical protein